MALGLSRFSNTYISPFPFGPLMIILLMLLNIEIICKYVFILVTHDTGVTNVKTYLHIISILGITCRRSIRGQTGNGETMVLGSQKIPKTNPEQL